MISLVRNKWLHLGLALVLAAGAALSFPVWWPPLSARIDDVVAASRSPAGGDDGDALPADDHAGSTHAGEHDGHGHAAHDEGTSLELTPQAMKNLGLTPDFLQPIQLSNYHRTVAVPAIVTPKPGRTHIQVASPMIGIVTHVHAVTGEAVLPGSLLFEVRLTYEDLVDTQTQLLKNLADLEIENREVARLQEVTRSGAVASKLLLDRQYAKQKLESVIASQRAALKLHGLSEEQVETIVREKRLLRDLTIVAPYVDAHDHEEKELRLSSRSLQSVAFRAADPPQPHEPIPLTIDELLARKGQGVAAGETLCTLSDYSTLYVEGRAFEQDAPAIAKTAAQEWPIEAIIPTADGEEIVRDLKLVYVANAVDPVSRTLSFYVNLPNQILRDETNSDGQRHITWKYRVGQRLQMRVPVEIWEQQIVLPVDAAVKDGADWFVFQQNGDHFDRVPVHVKYRDQANLVIENDGSVFPGDVVARRAAHQMQMALKNKSGAGADPHAGHNH